MPDSRRPQAERALQPSFRSSRFFNGLLIAGLAIGAHLLFIRLPDRMPRADASAEIIFTPVTLGSATPLDLAGAWQATSGEPRFGGLSALAIDRGELLAMTDSGVVIRLPRPLSETRIATFHDLPDGPGSPRRKSRRDSEALARLSDGDWLVAFENRDQVWRFDAQFRSGRRAINLSGEGWPRNRGIEAMTIDGDDRLLLIPEAQATVIAVDDGTEVYPLDSGGWTVSDAVRLRDGRQVALLRRITIAGFRNAIGEIVRTGGGWRVAMVAPLPIGRLDNAEGLAAESLPAGRTRLWIVTDNDGARYRRTLLLALDLPAGRRAN